MKISEMREMSLAEAGRQLVELRQQLAREKALVASGTRPENPGKIRGVRKNIARLLTVINEKKRKGEKEPVAEQPVAAAAGEKKGVIGRIVRRGKREKKKGERKAGEGKAVKKKKGVRLR